ncbi:hypothetical protein KCU85_g9112, partial [Aureobasidium melanogenum]
MMHKVSDEPRELPGLAASSQHLIAPSALKRNVFNALRELFSLAVQFTAPPRVTNNKRYISARYRLKSGSLSDGWTLATIVLRGLASTAWKQKPNPATYGHSQLKTGHPVRSAIHKQLNGRLVLRWVTTWESLLL